MKERQHWGLLDDDVLAWHQSTTMKVGFLLQLTEVRLVIEPNAARWAAERATDQEMTAIKEAQESMEREVAAMENFVFADAVYHRTILRAAHNEILRSMEGIIFSALLGSIRLTNTSREHNLLAIPYHQAVTQAILRRDGDAASAALTTLLKDTGINLARGFEAIRGIRRLSDVFPGLVKLRK